MSLYIHTHFISWGFGGVYTLWSCVHTLLYLQYYYRIRISYYEKYLILFYIKRLLILKLARKSYISLNLHAWMGFVTCEVMNLNFIYIYLCIQITIAAIYFQIKKKKKWKSCKLYEIGLVAFIRPIIATFTLVLSVMNNELLKEYWSYSLHTHYMHI